jgi:hypothetical protein
MISFVFIINNMNSKQTKTKTMPSTKQFERNETSILRFHLSFPYVASLSTYGLPAGIQEAASLPLPLQVEPAAATSAAAVAAAAAASKLKQLPGSLAEALAALQRDNSLQVRKRAAAKAPVRAVWCCALCGVQLWRRS